ncbi:MAG: hypothetical protein HY785_11040 [Oscillatoriophycideae cyanobacterium NC_groundwater_1537_Pr4_S-0.65um_50_18]|nr:hypothetical protein [Oscillatoriophycideae cyanobacterium NC_groundwater_1537_Pr4_S-0.65um_50_18]
MAKGKRKPEVRAYVDEDLDRLIKTIASLKGISISELLNQAIEVYLQVPEIQKIVERHRLDEIEDE